MPFFGTSEVRRRILQLFIAQPGRREGIEALLRQALGRVPGIERAWLFGSHADRTVGPDSDLDAMIVGTPSHAALSRPRIDLVGGDH